MVVELPTGELINTEHVARFLPLTSGYTRVFFASGLFDDYSPEHAAIIRKALTKKTK